LGILREMKKILIALLICSVVLVSGISGCILPAKPSGKIDTLNEAVTLFTLKYQELLKSGDEEIYGGIMAINYLPDSSSEIFMMAPNLEIQEDFKCGQDYTEKPQCYLSPIYDYLIELALGKRLNEWYVFVPAHVSEPEKQYIYIIDSSTGEISAVDSMPLREPFMANLQKDRPELYSSLENIGSAPF